MTVTRNLMILALLAAPLSAHAQQFFPDVGPQMDPMRSRPNVVRVQASYQMQIPLDRSAGPDDQKAALTASHATLYDLISHECATLKTAFNLECQLVSLNVGNTVQFRPNCTSVPINAGATFELFAAPAPKPTPPKP